MSTAPKAQRPLNSVWRHEDTRSPHLFATGRRDIRVHIHFLALAPFTPTCSAFISSSASLPPSKNKSARIAIGGRKVVAKQTRTITTFTDDLDGAVIEDGTGGTVRFGLDGREWEIDLSDGNRKELEKALKPYIEAGRSRSSRRSSGGTRSTANKEELAALRSWAKENGYEVSDRGRVSGEIREAYAAAQSSPAM